jgi:NTP pyrophosphatase (non-canonical NTP hydrolase)
VNLDDYQKKAIVTAIYPKDKKLGGLIYCGLKLNGEAGEVAEKIGKLMRDDNFKMSQEKREAILYELGDVLWYIANMANELEMSLSTIAIMNLEKLKKRKASNTIKGSGDKR